MKNEKLFFFPNLSACPTGATSDGTEKCKCTANVGETVQNGACACPASQVPQNGQCEG